MNAKETLKNFKGDVEKEIEKYFESKRKEANEISPHCKEMVDFIADMTLRGGKRVRAAILYYSYMAHGGKDKKAIMKVAVAMELMQTYLLIHDDIMDNDNLRRGGITVHKAYQSVGEERYPESNARHFGVSAGLLAGDLAGTMANEIMMQSGFDFTYLSKALNIFNTMYIKEYYGQLLDILSEMRNDVTKDEVILTHQLKTVPYTFDAPLKMGAVLAGADERELKKLDQYAIPLGTAFQIQDDILGLFGTQEKLGKPVASDLREGKRTLLILDAIEKGDKDQKGVIAMCLGNRRVNMGGLKAVRKVIEDTGALGKSKELAEKYVDEALDALSKNKNLGGEGREFLLGIADYMVKREY